MRLLPCGGRSGRLWNGVMSRRPRQPRSRIIKPWPELPDFTGRYYVVLNGELKRYSSKSRARRAIRRFRDKGHHTSSSPFRPRASRLQPTPTNEMPCGGGDNITGHATDCLLYVEYVEPEAIGPCYICADLRFTAMHIPANEKCHRCHKAVCSALHCEESYPDGLPICTVCEP